MFLLVTLHSSTLSEPAGANISTQDRWSSRIQHDTMSDISTIHGELDGVRSDQPVSELATGAVVYRTSRVDKFTSLLSQSC